jgi:replicative DNA helicase
MRDNLQRGLPAAIEAERSILGAILLDNKLAHEALAAVRADHFSLDAHRRIYAAMAALVDAGEPADPITLAEKLDRRNDLEAVGGIVCLSSLIDGVPERPSIAHYCKIVRERAVLRGLIYIAQNTVAEATEHGANHEHVLSRLESSLLALRSNTEDSEQATTLAEQLLTTLNALQRERHQDGELLGLTTCIQELDECTTGIREKEFWVIAAHPGAGKTAYASQVARANARSGRTVRVFSIEMSAGTVAEARPRHRVWSAGVTLAQPKTDERRRHDKGPGRGTVHHRGKAAFAN